LLRAYGCFLGPLKLHEAEAARSWLHEGALKAYFRVEDDLDAQVPGPRPCGAMVLPK
jgi:hypothetical protein